MLAQVQPRKPYVAQLDDVETSLQPMVRAALAGEPLEPLLLEILRPFGFDSFFYGLTTEYGPSRESQTYVWTSLPAEWVRAYDENAYLEVDPRIREAWNRRSPFVWDSAEMHPDARTRQFLQHAAKYGIRSGAMIAFGDPGRSRVGFGLNSSVSPLSPERRAEIIQQLGTLMVLGTRLHDLFITQIVRRGAPPVHDVKPLSPREKQCLTMAANGMTSADVGFKLGIAVRTANYHFGNAMGKLGVLNRNEAIAKAITLGLISVRA